MRYFVVALLVLLFAVTTSDSLAVSQLKTDVNLWLDVTACRLHLLNGFQCAIVDFNYQLKDL